MDTGTEAGKTPFAAGGSGEDCAGEAGAATVFTAFTTWVESGLDAQPDSRSRATAADTMQCLRRTLVELDI